VIVVCILGLAATTTLLALVALIILEGQQADELPIEEFYDEDTGP